MQSSLSTSTPTPLSIGAEHQYRPEHNPQRRQSNAPPAPPRPRSSRHMTATLRATRRHHRRCTTHSHPYPPAPKTSLVGRRRAIMTARALCSSCPCNPGTDECGVLPNWSTSTQVASATIVARWSPSRACLEALAFVIRAWPSTPILGTPRALALRLPNFHTKLEQFVTNRVRSAEITLHTCLRSWRGRMRANRSPPECRREHALTWARMTMESDRLAARRCQGMHAVGRGMPSPDRRASQRSTGCLARHPSLAGVVAPSFPAHDYHG